VRLRAIQNQFEITLEGFIDARTTNWLERVKINERAKGKSSEPLGNSLPQFDTPQALLDAVEQHGKSGSYEDFVKLFNDGGARDLAGSLLMQAVMQTSIEQTFGGLAEVDSDFVAFRKVLQRWLPQSATTAQQEAMGMGLSTMMSSIGGASLIDGSPGMATTITLQQASGTWRISSLFNELVIEAQPATTSPTSIASIPSNAKT
jgi:hypothetical protein